MTASGIFPMNEAVSVSPGQGEQKGGFRDVHVTLVAPREAILNTLTRAIPAPTLVSACGRLRMR